MFFFFKRNNLGGLRGCGSSRGSSSGLLLLISVVSSLLVVVVEVLAAIAIESSLLVVVVVTTLLILEGIEGSSTTAAIGIGGEAMLSRLHVNVTLLRHDEQLGLTVLRLGVESKESLGIRKVLKLNKDRALELLVIRATKTHLLDGSKSSKELFDIKLSGFGLITKTLGVNTTVEGIGTLLGLGLNQRRLTAHKLTVLRNFQELGRLLQRSNNLLKGLETAHAGEACNSRDGHPTVVRLGQLVKELVGGEVLVREVELNLLEDLGVIAGNGKLRGVADNVGLGSLSSGRGLNSSRGFDSSSDLLNDLLGLRFFRHV